MPIEWVAFVPYSLFLNAICREKENITIHRSIDRLFFDREPGCRRKLRSFMKISFNFSSLDFEAEDLKKYEHYAVKVSVDMVRNIMIGVLVVSLPFWPTDFWIFADHQDILQALIIWRISVITICIFCMILLKYLTFFKRHPILMFNLGGSLLLLITGYALGRTGGIENPTFYGIFAVPFITILLTMNFRLRILTTFMLPTAYLIGFFVPFPEHLKHPLIANPLLFILGVCITVIIAGEVINRLFALNFLRHLSLRKKAEQLLYYRRQLEQEVEERKDAQRELGLAKDELEKRVKLRTAELEQANERLTELAASLVTIQEQERNRISSELHDELGQLLTRLRMDNYYLLNLMPPDHPKYEEFKQASARSAEIIGQLQKSTRQLIMFLRTKVLDDEGLKAAVGVLCEDFKLSSGIDVSCSMAVDESELMPNVSKAIYRIVQESLTNISRHAAAGRVELACMKTADGIKISIKDDGRGFDESSENFKVGLGLAGMRNRASSVGGELTVKSGVGSGTEVTLHLPSTVQVAEERP